MTAHRYWRVAGTSEGGALAMAELQFRTERGVPRVPTGGTPIGCSQESPIYGTGFEKAYDANASTFWANSGYDFMDGSYGIPAHARHWLGYDFGAGNECDIVEIAITSRPDSPYHNQAPWLFDVQWSDDGTNWTTEWSDRCPSWGVSQTRVFGKPLAAAAGSFRHHRITITGADGGTAGLAEVQLRTEAGGPDRTEPTGASASSNDFLLYPRYAVDDNPSTFWGPGGGLPAWWCFDFGSNNYKRVVEWAITARNDGYHNQAPRTFRIEASNDYVTWVLIAEFTTGAWSSGETRIFETTPPLDPFRIDTLTPASSHTSGRGVVQIDGAGFEYGSLVTFGGIVVPSYFVSETRMLAIAPSRPAGPVVVAVTKPSTSETRSSSFTYEDAAITAIAPASATPYTALWVYGRWFFEGAVVIVGGVSVPTTRVSATELSAAVLALAPGTYDVQVMNVAPGYSELLTLAGALQVLAPPEVLSSGPIVMYVVT